MPVFKDYSKYYNLLYKDKDYKTEAEYVLQLISKNSENSRSILNLGCGTGNHDFLFAEKGYSVTGVDLSQDMIDVAKSKSPKPALEFIQGDIRNLNLNRKFDAVISLFHVLSYQTSNEDLLQSFQTAHKHLQKGGIFIFDCWYGPGVLTDRPSVRKKQLEDENFLINRLSTPRMYPNENCVDVQFEVNISDKKTNQNYQISEIHKMRYLFLPELKHFLDVAGFDLTGAEEWLSGRELTYSSWNATLICKRR